MTDDLQNVSDLVEELEGLAIRTSAGSYVKMEDVRRLIEKKQATNAVDEALPKPKNMHEAKSQAAEMLKKTGFGQAKPDAGKAVAASEPQPSSRT
jgi:hypothetical protein